MNPIVLMPEWILGPIGILGIFLFLWINKSVAFFLGAKHFSIGWCLLMWLNVSLFSIIAMFLFIFLINQFNLAFAAVFYLLTIGFFVFPLPAICILSLSYWRAVGMHLIMGFVGALIFGFFSIIAFYCDIPLITTLSEKIQVFKMQTKESQTKYMQTDLKTDPYLAQQVLKLSDALCQCGDNPVCLNQKSHSFNKMYLQVEPRKLPGDLKQAVAVAFAQAQQCLSNPSSHL